MGIVVLGTPFLMIGPLFYPRCAVLGSRVSLFGPWFAILHHFVSFLCQPAALLLARSPLFASLANFVTTRGVFEGAMGGGQQHNGPPYLIVACHVERTLQHNCVVACGL